VIRSWNESIKEGKCREARSGRRSYHKIIAIEVDKRGQYQIQALPRISFYR